MIKRIFLFALTNIFVILTITIVLNVLGLNGYMTQAGIDYGKLIGVCFVWGMVGSLISLAMSRFMAKAFMGVKVIDPSTAGQLDWYVNMVHNLARSAHLPAMPEVGVFESPESNAFATGPTKSRSLVAASTGLLSSMTKDEIEAVMAHEISHIQNGDMVTMTLIQGVVNAFVMFFARIIAYAVAQNAKEEMRYLVNSLVVIVLQIVFGLLGSIVTCWFSRQREFRADRGSAMLVGREKMQSALKALGRNKGIRIPEMAAHESLATLKISSSKGSGILGLFLTHPPLEERIEALSKL